MNFYVMTLFPDMVSDGLSSSIIGRARENGSIFVEAVNIRDFTKDKHNKADDYPYGGGAGLLMQAQPVFDAHRSIVDKIGSGKPVRTVYLTPQGRTFNQQMAEEMAKEENLIFMCGHYEGIDERALEEVVTDYVSLGDFVLTGGELPAMVLIDTIARLVPGVLHNDASASEESFSGYLLEYPQYTRPEVWNGKKVPEVLLTGDHKKIREWRKQMAEDRTRERRPDLYARYEKLMDCHEKLRKDKLHHAGMLELIARGQAELFFEGEEGILLRDKKSGVFMLTVKDREAGEHILEMVFGTADVSISAPAQADMFVVHQEYMVDAIKSRFGLKLWSGCYILSYTKKESLPKKDADIRKLDMSYLATVVSHYKLADKNEMAERLSGGNILGIFVENTLAGFIGEHTDGSMGMLEVFPEYQRQGLATALETDLANRTLQKGYMPFGYVKEDNAASLRLQEKMGFYRAKEKVWWLVREQ